MPKYQLTFTEISEYATIVESDCFEHVVQSWNAAKIDTDHAAAHRLGFRLKGIVEVEA